MLLRTALALLRPLFRSRAELALENLALRYQLMVAGIKKYIGPEIINGFQGRIKWVTECNGPVEAAFGFQS